jgi:hypothetical protein
MKKHNFSREEGIDWKTKEENESQIIEPEQVQT